MTQTITEPSTREEIEATLRAKIENDEAETGLYDTGLYFVSVDRVFDGKGGSELVFQWFDRAMPLSDVLCDWAKKIMWHTLSFVAESRRVDAKALTYFALAHEDAYGITTDCGEPEVNTWHVDKLVADFKARDASNRLTAAGGSDQSAVCPEQRRSAV